MDKQGKLIIVALVVLGLVCALALGTQLLPKQGEGSSPSEYSSAWLSSLDSLMGGWRPRLDPLRLQTGPGCRPKGGGYEFNQDDGECSIGIGRGTGGDDYQTATLSISNAARILVPCPPSESSGSATRGTTATLHRTSLTALRPRPQRLPVGGASAGEAAPTGPATLSVVYTPAGEDTPAPGCSGQDTVRLVVQQAGGNLSLRCEGCSPGQVVRVFFKE